LPPERTAVGVVFSAGGRVYSYDPGGLELAWDERVVCPTPYGAELGRVVEANHELDEPPPRPLKRVHRRATEADLETVKANRVAAKQAMRVFREILHRLELDVKPVAAELAFDGERLVFSYQAEGRPTLAPVQAELAARLGRRVELRSVGPRECARVCGDVGLCGGKHCIQRYPTNDKPVTLRMAKDQALPISSGRITGLCGRLRCCLAYEHPVYRSFRDRAPRVGSRVETPQGQGVVADYAVLADACVVELDAGAGRAEVALGDCHELRGRA
jgi:cell fate regulator YaaT (PSP1 superfamily)